MSHREATHISMMIKKKRTDFEYFYRIFLNHLGSASHRKPGKLTQHSMLVFTGNKKQQQQQHHLFFPRDMAEEAVILVNSKYCVYMTASYKI